MLDIDLRCIYSYLICVLCFVLPSLCVAGFRSIDFRLRRAWCLPFMVAGGTRRLRGQTRRGPLVVCRESRRRVVDGTGRQSGRILCLLWLSTLLWLYVSVFVVTMDRKPSEKQELLRKSSTDRLRDKLYQVGWDNEKVRSEEHTSELQSR